MSTKVTKNKQAATISFDRLGDLFDLKHEHGRLLREQAKMAHMAERGEDLRAVVELTDNQGWQARVKADVAEAARFMAETVERRLAEVEQRLGEAEIVGITREQPQQPSGPEQYADLDPEIPF